MHGTRGSHRDADFKSGELVKGWPSPVASAIWRQDTPKWPIRKSFTLLRRKPSKPRSIPAPGLFALRSTQLRKKLALTECRKFPASASVPARLKNKALALKATRRFGFSIVLLPMADLGHSLRHLRWDCNGMGQSSAPPARNRKDRQLSPTAGSTPHFAAGTGRSELPVNDAGSSSTTSPSTIRSPLF